MEGVIGGSRDANGLCESRDANGESRDPSGGGNSLEKESLCNDDGVLSLAPRDRNGSRDRSRTSREPICTSVSRDGVLSKLGRLLLPHHSSIVGLLANSETLLLLLEEALRDERLLSNVGNTGLGLRPRVSFSDS